MKRIVFIVLFVMGLIAQQTEIRAAEDSGENDFYFTLFDHWGWHGEESSSGVRLCAICVATSEHTDLTFSIPVGNKQYNASIDKGFMLCSMDRVDDAILKGVHFRSSGACFLHLWLHGTDASAETLILPRRLLGTQYMLQGTCGTELLSEGSDPVKTYSQFSIVGTKDGTTVTVRPRASLICVTTGQSVHQPTTFHLDEKDVLLFQTANVTDDISGTLLEANEKIAVFVGNTMTRIPNEAESSDYVWEQARPTNSWGKDFIIPMCSSFQTNYFKITALHDNTDLYFYPQGTKTIIKSLQAGESYGPVGIMQSDPSSPSLQVTHMSTSKPSCCYLYTTGASMNYNVGNPSMAEIAPVDRMATETLWGMLYSNENGQNNRKVLMVTTKTEDEDKVLYNDQTLSSYKNEEGVQRVVTDGYATYEIPFLKFATGVLKAEEGGFSAYILRIGTGVDASALNMSLGSMSLLKISVPRVCSGDVAVLTSEFENDGFVAEPVTYQWYFSSDQKNWIPISGATESEWHSAPVDNTYNGWYRLGLFEAGHDGDPDYCTLSNTVKMTVEECDPPNPELCMDGVLLFREDFGGNDPSDPVAGTEPVQGMSESYRQIFDTATCRYDFIQPDDPLSTCVGMGSGRYLVTKQGYRNAESYTYSHWFIMDDHTHPDDYSRGYFLEVDGRCGENAFYKTTINNLCEGTKLSFSAFVANITTGYSFTHSNWGYTYPKLSFILTSPDTGEELARYDTDTIHHEWRFYNTPEEWRHTAHWQPVGMSFVVPAGVNNVELSIVNNTGTSCGTGNDFAIDDIEVYACFPPVKMVADSVICKDSRNRFELNVNFNNNNAFVEPIVYQWFFSTDTAKGWSEIPDVDHAVYTPHFSDLKTGWYQVAVSGAGNTASKNCSAWSDPFHLRVDSNCVDLCSNGVVFYHEDLGNDISKYTTTISDLCTGSDLTFVVNVENGEMPSDYVEHPWLTVYPSLTFTILDLATQTILATYDTGNIPYNSGQREYGMKVTIPEGTEGVTWEIMNTTPSNTGIDLIVDNVEIRHCVPPISIKGDKEACRKQQHVFQVNFKNDGSVPDPRYQWSYSADSTHWSILETDDEQKYIIQEVHKYHEGWYRLNVASNGNFENEHCYTLSEPVWLSTKFCGEPEKRDIDTTACDTLMPIHWRDFEWLSDGTKKDTIYDVVDKDDSIYIFYHLHTKQCCPEIMIIPHDTAICDTLLPFLWIQDGQTLLFEHPGTQEKSFTHAKWEKCTGEIYSYTVDTFHCEKKWPIIVNKYNWQLLLDHVAWQKFFPTFTSVACQWYKNEEAIEGATADDYCEQSELNGSYQLRVQLYDGRYVWSNIIEHWSTHESHPVVVRIYNYQGIPVLENQMTHGVYLIHYQQGERVWTEKRMIP